MLHKTITILEYLVLFVVFCTFIFFTSNGFYQCKKYANQRIEIQEITSCLKSNHFKD